GAELDFHVAYARARRSDRQMHALRAGSDAAGFDDVQEQPQIGQIEAHAAILAGLGGAFQRGIAALRRAGVQGWVLGLARSRTAQGNAAAPIPRLDQNSARAPTWNERPGSGTMSFSGEACWRASSSIRFVARR